MLLELDLQKGLGWDGRWTSLQEAVADELLSDHLGWRPQDRERALDNIQRVTGDRAMVDYPSLFQRAWAVDVESIDREDALDLVVDSLVEYLSEIVTLQTSRWDAFGELNRIPLRPGRGESPKEYAGRIYGRLTNQEGRILIKRPEGFSPAAYEGFKTFFRVEGEASVGNCVTCHTPPFFTDFSFHDTGIARREYEAQYGAGSWAALVVPGESNRPVLEFLGGAGRADFGYWNWVIPAADDEASELEESIGAFRTPMLRNLPRTGPYMHNGSYSSLEAAVREYVSISSLARQGDYAEVDDEVDRIRLEESDVLPLVAFLKALDEVAEEDFHHLLTDVEPEDHESEVSP